MAEWTGKHEVQIWAVKASPLLAIIGNWRVFFDFER